MGHRDITQLSRKQLLDDYVAISKRRRGALVATALRTRSTSMRDILVHKGTKMFRSSEELKRHVLAGGTIDTEVTDFDAIADLGRLAILQNILDDDQVFGERLLTTVLKAFPDNKLSNKNVLVLVQYYVVAGEITTAQQLLSAYPKIDADYFEYLKAELLNPFSLGNEDTKEKWLSEFNRMFRYNNVRPILVESGNGTAFDRIKCPVSLKEGVAEQTQPLVSIVLTAYRPDRLPLLTSVNSILQQTWQNLELIVVDDCSGPEFEDIFAELNNLDARIRIIHAPTNGGTYAARNLGYTASRGAFITGQDDDDWSHPERLAKQVEYLRDHPEAIGCRVTAVRCDENLGRVRVGYSPMGENASSLLIRREGYLAVGGYLEGRKAADTEFHFRLIAATGRPIGRVRAPLSIIRILPNSLSRGDFAAGWKHTSRRSFRSSYEYWHRKATSSELKIEPGSRPAVFIPQRFRGSMGEGSNHLDVVFAGNWEKNGGPQKSMLEEIHALVGTGLRVGIINFEAARFMSNSFQTPLNDDIQRLINVGYVDEVHYDDLVHIRLLILRYPPILQFFRSDRTSLKIERMIILANQAPSEQDGQDVRYLVDECHRNAQLAFGVTPVWVPQGPLVRTFLSYYLDSPALAGFDLPGILNVDDWWNERNWYRSITPVVGRVSRDNSMKWPDEKPIIEKLYPTDGSADVRIMGGAATPLKIMGVSKAPMGWTVYGPDEIAVPSFLQSLDYFVFFQHSLAIEAFGRAILEALAAGVVVILPPHFEKVFGEAALYTEPDGVAQLIRELHADFSTYRQQLRRSRSVVKARFSYEKYRETIDNVLQNASLGENV